MIINGRVCDLNELPEIIAREPNGTGVRRDYVLERTFESLKIRLSDLPATDQERLFLKLTEPRLSYAEGVTNLRLVVEDYNRCAEEPVDADELFNRALNLIEAQNGLAK